MPATLTKDVREKLSTMVERIVDRFHPRRIILFGSYATGRADSDSDADLVVLAESQMPSLHLAAEISAAVEHVMPLDILVFRPDDWEASVRRGGRSRDR